MYILTLSKEDFAEEIHWVALCDSLDVDNTATEVMLTISDVVELH